MNSSLRLLKHNLELRNQRELRGHWSPFCGSLFRMEFPTTLNRMSNTSTMGINNPVSFNLRSKWSMKFRRSLGLLFHYLFEQRYHLLVLFSYPRKLTTNRIRLFSTSKTTILNNILCSSFKLKVGSWFWHTRNFVPDWLKLNIEKSWFGKDVVLIPSKVLTL